MATEIERKFLVDTAAWQPRDGGTLYRQGYLSSVVERVVRVRVAGNAAKLTIKGATVGVSRLELEYDIPVDEALQLLTICEQPLVEKVRHTEVVGGKTWEVDVFLGANAGLVVAELELAAEDEPFERPPWITEEVSGDPRYYNNNLIRHPFERWGRVE